jgi:hypothetical protein
VVEQLIRNQQVVSSILTAGSILFSQKQHTQCRSFPFVFQEVSLADFVLSPLLMPLCAEAFSEQMRRPSKTSWEQKEKG